MAAASTSRSPVRMGIFCAEGGDFVVYGDDHLLLHGFMPNVAGEWRVFLATQPDRPLCVALDPIIREALECGDHRAWVVLLEFLADRADT